MSRPPRRASHEKVTTLEALVREIRGPRSAERKVVFTNGCFDLLHVGHLRLLEAAADLGDVLVVGLNGDESVRRLKGPSRPLLPFSDRASLLAALETVDWVVGFDEDTPEALIRAILPDVLVKGGDWAPDRIVGREAVESRGGRVVTVPLVIGRSTSAVIDRVRASEAERPARPTEEPPVDPDP